MASPVSSEPRKAAKDLACADCQRRKKRCDKQSPCSNCIKHNVPCVPSSPAPPRKRRQPMKELLERLAACEERLKHCNCHQSGFPDMVGGAPSQPLQQQHSYEHSHDDHHHHHHGAPPSPPASAASRDAAIANVLDHGDKDDDGYREKQAASRYYEYSPRPAAQIVSMGDMRAAGT